MDREARVQAMVDWFFENFEDPANRTPYESAEGGYIWIWGGPHDAEEEIGGNFPDEDQTLIDAAVEEVQRRGIYEWAPTESPGDYDPEPDEPKDELGTDDVPAEGEVGRDRQPSDLEDILASIPVETSGPFFDRTSQERVDLIDWNGAAAPDGALLSALRERTAELVLELYGTNAHPDLLRAISRYAAAVNAVPASVPQLYIEGVFLGNVAAQCEREIAAGDRPPLPGTVLGGLATLLHLHGTLLMSTPTGAALVEAGDRYVVKPRDQELLNRSIVDVAHAIHDTPAVFGPTARHLAEVALANVNQGERPNRSNHATSLLLKRMLAAAGKVVRFAAIAVAGTILANGMVATLPGAIVTNAVTALGNAAWGFFVGHLDALRTFAALAGSDLGWLRQLVAWLQARR